jgi:hypothetical protein
MSKIKSVGQILGEAKEFEKIRTTVENTSVVKEFKNIFPEFKKVAKPKRVQSKTLLLRVEDSVWRNELNINKRKIVEKINKHFGKEIIKNIRFI